MQSCTNSGYDLIGDIHGHADTLESMLLKLGYSHDTQGHYAHETRQVIFLGDFIDRNVGGQRKTLEIVRPMIENGSALAVMGNHEFNAISYYTQHPETGEPLRSRTPNRRVQHEAFLQEYENDEAAYANVIEWFKTLPLFLELDELRVIHACWQQPVLDSILPVLDEKSCLTDDFLVSSNDDNHPHFDAVETLLKGLEVDFPDGVQFQDGYGTWRSRMRVKWWEGTDAVTYRALAQVPAKIVDRIPNVPLSAEQLGDFRYDHHKPVFFGHYWFTGEPCIQQHNLACLDYSVAKGDKLVAYRWNHGDKVLDNNRFVQVNCEQIEKKEAVSA